MFSKCHCLLVLSIVSLLAITFFMPSILDDPRISCYDTMSKSNPEETAVKFQSEPTWKLKPDVVKPKQWPKLADPSWHLPQSYGRGISSQFMAGLLYGKNFGFEGHLVNMMVGTPPKFFPLIIDTASDLIWMHCAPCHDCYEQSVSYFDPKSSESYQNINCLDPRCDWAPKPDNLESSCSRENQTCPYYYIYGDEERSSTTGDIAVETFILNRTSFPGSRKSELAKIDNVVFGCGYWNRGLFSGCAGFLGLGRGNLSFASQIQSQFGHSFSYCLGNKNTEDETDARTQSKLIFGQDAEHYQSNMNFTSFVQGTDETFYYVQIRFVIVGGEVLVIPQETWGFSSDGSGGTIMDSGTTLSFFRDPAYEIIKEAFLKKVNKDYPLVQNDKLHLCYNVSGVDNLEMPEFGIVFADGAVWNFPVENYFIPFNSKDSFCLGFLPYNNFSIIGDYLQRNFYVWYDARRSTLGYAPMKCADG